MNTAVNLPKANALHPVEKQPGDAPRRGRFGAYRGSRTAGWRMGGAGVSLLEMLVVLVLASLLSTLLVQGLGFFLAGMEAVQRHSGRAASLAMQQRWFTSTVGAMVPYLAPDRNFIGDAAAFEGVTLEPLNAPPGLPRKIRWSIADDDSVRYAEGDELGWIVLQEPDAALRFEYAGRDGEWRTQWRALPQTRQWIPSLVRLTAEDGRVLWLAGLALHPEPVLNFLIDDQKTGEGE